MKCTGETNVSRSRRSFQTTSNHVTSAGCYCSLSLWVFPQAMVHYSLLMWPFIKKPLSYIMHNSLTASEMCIYTFDNKTMYQTVWHTSNKQGIPFISHACAWNNKVLCLVLYIIHVDYKELWLKVTIIKVQRTSHTRLSYSEPSAWELQLGPLFPANQELVKASHQTVQIAEAPGWSGRGMCSLFWSSICDRHDTQAIAVCSVSADFIERPSVA